MTKSRYVLYGEDELYVCCQSRAPIVSFLKVRRLSFHPVASAYDLIWRKSAHGPALLLFHEVKPKFIVFPGLEFGATLRLSV